jgi:hypothetical protein
MRIPLYTAQSRATSEAPGRSITARKNVQLAAQTELAKASPFSAFADEVGEYAKERYKTVRNNLLAEADIAAEEALFKLRNDLEKTRDYNNILDGDNPRWMSGSNAVKEEIRKKVGKDNYSQNYFNTRFSQLELKHRFQLRNQVDRQIQIASGNNFSTKLVQGERQLSDYTLDAYDRARITSDIKIFTNGYVSQTGASTTKVNETIKAMELGATRNALTKFIADQRGSEITTLTAIRNAIRDGRKGELLDTNPMTGEGDSLAARGLEGGEELYKRLTQLDDDDLASVIKTSASDIASIYGPGFEEKAKKSQLTSLRTALTSQTDDLLNQLKIEGRADSQAVSNLLSNMDDVIRKDPSVSESFKNKRNELALVSTVAATVRTADIDDLNRVIKDMEEGTPTFGGAGLDTEAEQAANNFLKSRRNKMITALNNDALQWGRDNGVIEEPVENLFDEEGNFDPNLVALRNVNATTVEEHYNLSEPQYLTKNEVDSFKRIIKKKDLNPNTKLAFVANFQKAWGGAAAAVFTQMGEKDAHDMAALGSLVNAGRNDAALAIMKGMEEFDAGLKLPSTAGLTSPEEVFTAFITDDDGQNIFARMDPNDLDAMFTLAKAHFKGRGIMEYDEDLFLESLNTVVGADGDRGGIREVRGQKTLLPPEMTADEVENFLDNLSTDIVNAMNIIVGETPDDPDLKLSEALIYDIRNRNDDYVLKYFNADEYYIMDESRNGIVRYPNGDPFIINLYQMQLEFPNAFTEEVKRGFFTGRIKE